MKFAFEPQLGLHACIGLKGQPLKKAVITGLKLAVPAAIFAYLLSSVQPEDYQAFWRQSKRWDLVLAAQLLAVTAILISILRWRVLVRAFEIPFTLKEAMRLGFLGYLLNFVSFGSVGGDVFKAILVARDKPDKRPEAVASVLLDRAFGLLGLVILAFMGLVLFPNEPLTPLLAGIRNGAGLLAATAVVGLLVAVFAGRWFERLIAGIQRVPWMGDALARMTRAVRLLRHDPIVILLMIVYSIGVHALLASTVFLLSRGLYPQTPTFAEHLMIVPPAMAAGTLPLAPGGIGYQEGALAGLFKQLPDLPEGFSGILVATIYRLVTLAIAGIGLLYYWSSHGREFKFVSRADQPQAAPPTNP